MTQTVTVPGVGDLEFPDGMSQQDMASAIQKNFPQIHSASAKQTATETPKTSEGFVSGVKEAVSNIPSSVAGVAGNLLDAVLHPVNTAKGVLDIGAGAMQAAFAPESFKKSDNPALYDPRAEQAFNAAVDFYKKRYGSWDNFLNTVKKDPAGTALDLSTVGGLLGTASKAAGLTRTASAVSKASELVDPVRQTAKLAKGVIRPAYEYGVGMTTGAGAQTIKYALQGGDAFTQAMRGQISETDVLDTARNAVQKIKDDRGAAYRARLQDLAGNKSTVDLQSVMNDADSWLGKYGITKTADGKLDFSRSTLRANPTAAKEVQAVYDAVRDYGTEKVPAKAPGLIVSEKGTPLTAGVPAATKPARITPLELDILKRTVDDSYSSTRISRAMVKDLSNKIKAKIVREVPEYATMTKDYAKASDIIDDMNQGLGTSDRVATDTALRKLMTAMREDKTFRRGLIDTLDKTTGSDVAGAVSGLLMKNPWTSRLGPIAHFYGTSAAAMYLHNPLLAGLLPLASPRLMGEVSRAAGKIPGAALAPVYQTGIQAARIPGLSDGGLYQSSLDVQGVDVGR